AVTIGFDDGHEMRYSDQRRMGRWYLVAGEAEITSVPQMEKLGPDVMGLEEDRFLALMKSRRGQVKNTITNQEVFAGIGNAYSDEILWEAGIHPHRKGSTLSEDDWRRVHAAIRSVLEESIRIVDETVQEEGLGKKE